MDYGICNLSNIPLRSQPDHTSEMLSEVLFGDHFKIIGISGQWLKIKLAFDEYEGWVHTLQCIAIEETYYTKLNDSLLVFSNNLVDFIEDESKKLYTVVLGSRLPDFTKGKFNLADMAYAFEGTTISGKKSKDELVQTAFMYLNAPYVWGGKTPFGIDCSGFTQMVYKINGYRLFRDVSAQATQGEVLSFIEESEPGDLAFFDDEEGSIIHAGIILANNYIIHASGKVRVDRLDQSGIYNNELKRHTHKLRVIKKLF